MIHLEFLSSYQGRSDFMVHDGKEEYRASWNFGVPNYDSNWNMTLEEFKRDIEGALNLVHRSGKDRLKKEVFETILAEVKRCRPGQAPFTKPAFWDNGWQIIEY